MFFSNSITNLYATLILNIFTNVIKMDVYAISNFSDYTFQVFSFYKNLYLNVTDILKINIFIFKEIILNFYSYLIIVY